MLAQHLQGNETQQHKVGRVFPKKMKILLLHILHYLYYQHRFET